MGRHLDQLVLGDELQRRLECERALRREPEGLVVRRLLLGIPGAAPPPNNACCALTYKMTAKKIPNGRRMENITIYAKGLLK